MNWEQMLFVGYSVLLFSISFMMGFSCGLDFNKKGKENKDG